MQKNSHFFEAAEVQKEGEIAALAELVGKLELEKEKLIYDFEYRVRQGQLKKKALFRKRLEQE